MPLCSLCWLKERPASPSLELSSCQTDMKAYKSAEGRTFGQRHRRRRSAIKSTQWGTGMDECLDEMQYDSTSVDDWGVNRDMQKAYRYGSLPLHLWPQCLSLNFQKRLDIQVQ